jgi:pyrimidine deaminase RibD-like protein
VTELPGPAAAGPGPRHRALVPGTLAADRHWLGAAIELSGQCPPSPSAFSVGAILVSPDGRQIAAGFSRQTDPADHAEEVTLASAAEAGNGTGRTGGRGGQGGRGQDLAGATIYCSLEPCLRRASRPVPCAELILAAGLRRVVLAWLEPPLFVPGGGARWLRDRGVTVVQLPELAGRARAVNAHLLDR